jgi:hypothetical protein
VTVTDPGTVKLALLSERLTTVPPLGAGSDSVTVQVDDAPDARVVGAHVSAEVRGRTVIVPPVATMFASVPLAKAPNTLLKARESNVLMLDRERDAVTTATTPLPMAVPFTPDATQTRVPAPGLQLSVFPAAVSADPVATLSVVMAVVGYDRLHPRLAGALVVALNERLSERGLPWTADPEAKLKEGACP